MDKYIEAFENYVASFDLEVSQLKRKKEHTYRVIKLCMEIAKSLQMNDHDVFLMKLIGLYHDIGRFDQFKQFSKFNDSETYDHASKGVIILNTLQILDDLEEKDLILKAIENHNQIKLEENLSPREKQFCEIIRDADKLDILNLVIEGKIKMNPYDEKYSEKAVQTILNGECIDLKEYPRKVDQSLVKIGLMNDIVFPFSKQYILKNNMIDELIEIYIKNNPKEKDTLEKIKKKVKERMNDTNVR